MTPRPEVAAALAALSPEERALLSKTSAAAIIATIEEMAAEGRARLAEKEVMPHEVRHGESERIRKEGATDQRPSPRDTE
jgi:hypothetical protein